MNKIKRDYIEVNSPRQKSSIDRALSIFDNTQLAVRIQAERRFREPKASTSKSLWSEETKYTIDCITCTATPSNPDYVSPDEKCHSTPGPLVLHPYLQPGYFRLEHPHKDHRKVVLFFFLGPTPLNSHDTSQVLVAGTTKVSTTRDVNWTAYPDFEGPLASQETSENERPRDNTNSRLAPATIGDPDENDDTSDRRFSDSNEDSVPKSPIAEFVRQDYDIARTNGHDVRQPHIVEAD